MSHGKLREEKNCLNCGQTVEEKFCPNCGQENTESKKPFHYLFTHFIEDFTHYDGQFWGTIKNLLFKPGKLTNIYLEGKRQQFVPPVKLYIFISFLTFFLFAMFPPFNFDFSGENKLKNSINKEILDQPKVADIQKKIDSIKAQPNLEPEDSTAIENFTGLIKDSATINNFSKTLDMNKEIDEDSGYNGYKNRKSYDSAVAKNPSSFDFINVPFAHKYFELKEKGVKKGDILRGLGENSLHNLPKALFIYLPLFAFFLWIFHNKKKWWYFDHGVFTLHYFSFLLLNILLFVFLSKATNHIEQNFINTIIYFIMTALAIYSMVYFFLAHHQVYKTHGLLSFIIGWVLFSINFIAFLFLAIGLGVVSFLMIH
jgi:hypothetical protein